MQPVPDVFQQHHQQLTFNLLNHIHHALDHLTGQVPEILRHHDVQQLSVGEAGVARHIAQN